MSYEVPAGQPAGSEYQSQWRETFALPHIAARIFNTPLLIEPSKLDAIIYGLQHRLGVKVDEPEPGLYSSVPGERRKPGYRLLGNVGVIDIFGALAHRGGLAADSSYILGYQRVSQMLNGALADPEVRSVLLNIDSPGGEAAGAFELAAEIRDARGTKPVIAMADSVAASAGYLIGSAASEVYAAPTGSVGSIGVVLRHVDFSAALAQDGIRVTHIFAGAHKVDGNPYEALPESVRTRFQAEVQAMYEMFVQAVGTNRGKKLSQAAARATEAAIFSGADARDVGLVDGVTTANALLQQMQERYRSGSARAISSTKWSTAMSESDEKRAAAAADIPQTTFTQSDLDAAHAEGVKTGTAAECERIHGILTHEEAKGRLEQAVALARVEGMSPKDAGAVLATMPKAEAGKGANGEFAAAMSRIQAGQDVGADDAQLDGDRVERQRLDSIVDRYGKMRVGG